MQNIKKLLEDKSITELEELRILLEELVREKELLKTVSFDTYFMEVMDLIGNSGHTSMQKGVEEWHEYNQGNTVYITPENEYTMARLAVIWAHDYKRNPETADEFYATEYEYSVVEKWENTH